MQQRFIIFLFLLMPFQVSFLSEASGQGITGGNSADFPGLGHRQSIYMEALDEGAAIYTGESYIPERLTEGHVFFQTSGWSKGSVVYNGTSYEDIPVLYDLVKDELVILYYNGSSKITLQQKGVEQFSLLGHSFIQLPFIRVKGKDINPGFYDRLFKGETEVIVKRTKTVKEDKSLGVFKRYAEEKNRLYIKKNNDYYAVKSKGSVLRVFKDKRKELRRFVKENKIEFYNDRESAMVEVARHYDKLTKGQ